MEEMISTIASAEVGRLPWWLIWGFFALFGFVASIPALYYAVKLRENAMSLAQALGGGAVTSTGLAAFGAALGAQIEGVTPNITWAEAAVLAGLGFLVGSILCPCAGILAIWVMVIRPIGRRFGAKQAARGWVELFSGSKPLIDWSRELVRAIDVEEAWDEFACAAQDVHDRFEHAPGEAQMLMKLFGKVTTQQSNDKYEQQAIRLVRNLLEPLIKTLTARLTRTTLNFTVWRVHENENALEHLISFPMEISSEKKDPLPIWSDTRKADTACLAADAMRRRKYMVVYADEQWPTHWHRRRLGESYDAVGCMPIPNDHEDRSPWGVLCIEIREGAISLRSDAMRLLAGRLAEAVERSEKYIRKRSLDDTFNQ